MDYSKMHFGSLTVSKIPEYPASHEGRGLYPLVSPAAAHASQEAASSLSLPPPPAVFQEQGSADFTRKRYDQLQRRIADLMAAHSLSYIDLVDRALDRFEVALNSGVGDQT